MKQTKFIISQYQHLSQILFFMSHHRGQPILGLFSSEKQSYFYNFAITNLKYTNIQCHTFQQIQSNPQLGQGKICMIMQIPTTFQSMLALLKSCQQSVEVIIVLMRDNKKYINMITKKIFDGKFNHIVCQYTKNDLVGINKKLRQLVDQSYDMNRAAFYAYGAYLNNFRANLLKFIFKTQDIDVAALAKSFGFNTPPRVKQGSFMKIQVRRQKLKQKNRMKKLAKKDKQTQQQQQDNTKQKRKLKSDQKLKLLAAKKAKRIIKQRKNLTKNNTKINQKAIPSTIKTKQQQPKKVIKKLNKK